MKAFTHLVTLTSLLLLMSFDTRHDFPAQKVVGTYSVCACEGRGTTSPALTLNEDYTFSYHFEGEKKTISGNWSLKNQSIYLHTDKDFQAKWRIEKTGNCISSRTGMTFYRLCNVKSCK